MASEVYLTGLCGNSSADWIFWSYDLSWNTKSPDLTSCFKETVLQWVPCGYLWIFALFYFPMLSKRQTVHVRHFSKFNVFKIVLTVLLMILTVIDFINAVMSAEEKEVPIVLYLNPAIEIVSLIIATIMIRLEYRKGIHSSGTVFFFWLFQFLSRLIVLASESIRISRGTSETYPAVMSIIGFILVTTQFLAHCFADRSLAFADRRSRKEGDERKPLLEQSSSSSNESSSSRKKKILKPCPELQASILSRLTFTWITGLIFRGYRRAITSSDVWDLRPSESCGYIVPRMEEAWEQQLKKSSQSINEDMEKQSHSAYHFSNGSSKHNKLTALEDTFSMMQEVQAIKKRPDKNKHMPSLVAALMRVFGSYYAFAGVLKLVTDMLNFAQPQLLKALISFVSDSTAFEWHGYVLAVALFLVAFLRTMIFQQYWQGCYATGMHLRTAVIAMVYRKALKLSGTSRKDTTVGEIVNLMSVDAQKLQDAPGFMHMLWTAPISIVIAMYFLWQELGASCLAGVGVMIILIPINGVIVSKIKSLQIYQMKLKDQRIKLMNEVLNGVKVLKLYAWEKSFEEQISEIRNNELVVLRTAAYMNAITAIVWFCAPFLVAVSTFSVYVLSSPKNILTSQKAFVSLSLFNIMNFPLSVIPAAIAYSVQVLVSIRRLTKYLTEEELDPNNVQYNPMAENAIRITGGTFSWDNDVRPVLNDINLSVPDGKLYAVVGGVGSGKSSLINSILGELVRREGRVVVKGSIAYVPQQAWCQNCSMQDNILFAKHMHRNKYNKVLEACALNPDLRVLPAGDKTEIGEKGINLSGGQKQRVSLARAVYQDADIYLLDDPLSAVDSHVGKQLFEQVISNSGLLGNKTRVLVTHGLSFLPKVDSIIVLKDGVITEMGSYSELLSHDGAFAEFIRTYLDQESGSETEDEEDEAFKMKLRRTISVVSGGEDDESGKSLGHSRRRSSHHRRRSSAKEAMPATYKKKEALMTVETAETGSVSFAVFAAYMKSLRPAGFLGVLFSYIAFIAFQVSTNIWLSVWSEDTSAYNDTALRDKYLGVYGALGISQSLSILVQSFALAYGTFCASQKMHSILLKNVLRTPMSFFDTTPLGRILNRFGKDIDTVDLNIPSTIRSWLITMATVIGTLIVVSIASPVFLVALVPLAICYYFAQRFYICTSRQLKRIDSVKRSPIYSHFQESIVGASSVRAYKRQDDFIQTSDELVDDNQMVWYPNIISYRWLGFILETLGNFIILFAGLFAVLSRSTIGAGLAGASVSYSLQVTGSLNYMVRMTCDMEAYIVAVERIMEYAKLDREAPLTTDIRPQDAWPTRGRIEFRNYSVRYRPGLDLVLKDINAEINPGEMVGIVGRTGAGKSSLTLALFRILEPAAGDIVIDDINIRKIGLEDLRKKITIIPQDPVLFSGTLRMNMDPFDSHTDGEVWTALEQAHLKTFVSSQTDGLEMKCSEGGENMSVGQRQLLCLARALLRKTKVLVLDEATAAVDLETDDLIQNTIRREFQGCTILTIAHRLNTIMDYDKIMVLDRGQIREFESPGNLLKRPSTIFYSMCQDAGLV